jgi:membrane dipeptidase
MGRGTGEAYERIRDRCDPRAVRLYEGALVWDMTMPFSEVYGEFDVALPRFAAAGVDVISLTVQNLPGPGIARAVPYLARVRAGIARRADRMALCATVAEVRAAKGAGKLALLLNHQDGTPLGGMPEMVGVYHRLGIRVALLAYNAKNELSDGCAERTDEGLTRLGRRVVEAMLAAGTLCDGTHMGRRSSLDLAEMCAAAGRPMAFTHSIAFAVHPHCRNIADEQIRACAATGGAVGVNGLGEFLPDAEARTEAIFAHLDHIVSLAGAEHAGVGLDYLRDEARFWAGVRADAAQWPDPPGGDRYRGSRFAQPEQLLELTDAMVRRGYPDAAVEAILGGNWARVCEAAWRPAPGEAVPREAALENAA